jgi:hypothetical protein
VANAYQSLLELHVHSDERIKKINDECWETYQSLLELHVHSDPTPTAVPTPTVPMLPLGYQSLLELHVHSDSVAQSGDLRYDRGIAYQSLLELHVHSDERCASRRRRSRDVSISVRASRSF